MNNKVLVADKAGQPHYWASWQDAVVLKYKDLLSYELGNPDMFFGGTSRMTGERSNVEVGQIVFLKTILKYDARVPPLTNQNLFARDLHICGYCAQVYPESKLSRDHIHPVSKGGKNTWQNCVTACKRCNHEKDDNMLSDTELELVYVPYVPSHSERLIMQNRNVLVDQMDYLKAFLPEHSRILQAHEARTMSVEEVEAILPAKAKRHFMSGLEMAAIKRSEEIENSQNRRRAVPKF